MRTADVITRSIVFALGIAATFAFVVTKIPATLAWATSRSYEYGDLYRFAKISDFKPETPLPRGSLSNGVDSIDAGQLHPHPNDNVWFGDSFSFCDWGKGPMHSQLQQKLGVPLFSIYNNHHASIWENPCLYLNSPAVRSQSRRIVVFEIVERSIQMRFDKPRGLGDAQSAVEPSSSALSKLKSNVLQDTEVRHEALLENSNLTFPAIAIWNTLLFHSFRLITPETPLFSLNPPFLFYKDEVQCFETAHSDELIGRLADNIASLRDDLESKLDYRFVFIPAPNKITLYSYLVKEKPYDDFLPRLCAALHKRGVNTVDLLPALRQQDQLLYWPTDTHWNNSAIRIAVDKASENWPRH